MAITTPVGQVLRSSTIGFTVGCPITSPDSDSTPNIPDFGDLVQTALPNDLTVFGLVYDVRIQDDAAVRQVILAKALEPTQVLDQLENRLGLVEISVLAVGYQRQNKIIQGLPPQPPITLDSLIRCEETALRKFTSTEQENIFQLDYIRLVLNAAQVPADELLVANLTQIAAAHPPELRRKFLLDAGRELARLLSFDLVRLDGILKRIKP